MRVKTTKTVWYKRAVHPIRGDLQSNVLAALGKLPDPYARLFAPNGPDGSKFSINGYQSHGSCLVGQFLGFQPGQKQPVIKLNPAGGVQAFDIDATSAGAPGNEFLDGLCYFLMLKDHVLFVSSKALGSREFERYIRWLLCEATTLVPIETVITISDQVALDLRQRAAKKRVRAITFGSPLTAVSVGETVGQDSVFTFEPKGGMWDVLKDALGPNIFERVKLTNALEQSNLEVQVRVRIRGKRSIGDDAAQVLDAVASAARHLHPDDVELEVQGVGTLKGHDLKLHRALNVTLLESGGLVSEGDLWTKMSDWLMNLIDTGTVPA